jgi:N-acetylglucosamine-6-sulfatase
VKGQGRYVDPPLNDNGREVQGQGYVTDIFTDRAEAFLRKPRQKPFCLYLSHKAVHPDLEQRADGTIVNALATNFVPAERHAKLYDGVTIPRRPNCDDTLAGKPALQRKVDDLPPLSKETGSKDHEILGRQRLFASVDEGIGKLLKALDDTGHRDDTIVVFSSDHGYFYGEHGLSFERRLAYEEAIRIPLIIRYPGVVVPITPLNASVSVIDANRYRPVLSIDVGPTILDWCGTKYPHAVTGRSFAQALQGDVDKWEPRFPFLVEQASDNVFARMRHMGYDAVRGERYKFIRYREFPGMEELYDLQADPYEMKNLAGDPATAEVRRELESQLERLIAQ